MSLEHLIFCLMWELVNYVDNKDKELTKYTIVKIAIGAYEGREKYQPKPTKGQRKRRIKNKSGMIVNPAFAEHHGVSKRSVANNLRGHLSEKTLNQHYDFTKSVKDNSLRLKEQGIKPNSPRALYNFLKKKGIGTKDYKN